MPTDQQTQVNAFLEQFRSGKQTIDRVLSDTQTVIAGIDHLAAMAAKWQAALAGEDLDPDVRAALVAIVSLSAVQGILADQQVLKAALVAYRDKHQGV